jgi:uncharacterized protein YjiK
MPENAAVPARFPTPARSLRPDDAPRPRSRAGRLAAAFAIVIAALLTLAVASAGAAEIAEVDLAKYKRVGRFDLPAPSNTTPPNGTSLLAQEASGVTYDPEDGHLYVVGDGGTSVVEVDKEGHLVSSMTLAAGDSPQGTTFYDTEGIAFLGEGKFALTEERRRWVDRFTYVAEGTLTRADVETVKLGTELGNIGNEGITADPVGGGLILVKEMSPEGIFATVPNWEAGTASNGSESTVEPSNLFDPTKVGTLDFSDVFALANLAEISAAEREHLLIISQESGRVVNVDREGNVHSSLTLVGDSDNALSIPAQTDEGVTMDDEGNLYVVNEKGGGDGNPQLWVYAPQTATDTAPTAVTLTDPTTELPENVTTSSRIRLAGVSVTDPDGFGENDLSVAGPDASSFEVDSNGLYLKAGTTLDAASKATYEVEVLVDDPAAGSSPDATSGPYTLTISPVSAAPSEADLAVTEVAPWSSTHSPFKADWFEVTNKGAVAVDLSGAKVDDDSNSFGAAVALEGVGSLRPGESAVFVEGTTATVAGFEAAWFPGGTTPAGLQIGHYSGSGVGLSSGGDQVNVFDAAGEHLAGIAFGVSPGAAPFTTFVNSAGLGSGAGAPPTITTQAAVGVDGAFAVDGGNEVGSPGAAPVPTPVAVTEVAPWGNGEVEYEADWFELTNETAAALDLSGWKMDDSSDAFGNAVALEGVSTLAPGESALFLETESATTVANFKQSWFGSAVPAGLQVGTYHGSGVGLGGSGDAVNVFNAEGAHLTGVSFGASTNLVSFDNAAALGSFGTPAPISTLSAEGVNGAFVAHDQIGSPGLTESPPAPALPAVKVTEVDPSGSGAAYGTDWFELTNEGGEAVDLSGWKADDESDEFAAGGALVGVSSLPAGASAIFVEKPAQLAAFEAAWFPAGVPNGFLVGSYEGAGGLSGSGDEVNIFDAAGEAVTGVRFGAGSATATFDNAAGIGDISDPPPTISTLSRPGFAGAFRNAAGEVGSPGATTGETGVLGATTPVFPTQAANTISLGQWVTVTDEGAAAVAISRVRVIESDEASAGDFIVSADHCGGESIAAGGTCKVQVRFAPGREEATSSAHLVIVSDAQNSPLEVSLSGTSAGLPEGPAGPAGPEGPEGPIGPEGPEGPTGPVGPAGPQGPTGDRGAEGPRGATGAPGPAGKDGKDGVVSFTSSDGEGSRVRRGRWARLRFVLENGTAGPLRGARVSAHGLGTRRSRTLHVAKIKAGGSRHVTLGLPVGRHASLGRHQVKVTMKVAGHTVTETVTLRVIR